MRMQLARAMQEPNSGGPSHATVGQENPNFIFMLVEEVQVQSLVRCRGCHYPELILAKQPEHFKRFPLVIHIEHGEILVLFSHCIYLCELLQCSTERLLQGWRIPRTGYIFMDPYPACRQQLLAGIVSTPVYSHEVRLDIAGLLQKPDAVVPRPGILESAIKTPISTLCCLSRVSPSSALVAVRMRKARLKYLSAGSSSSTSRTMNCL